MRIALGIEYKGEHYCGWQRQTAGIRTLQEQLEDAIARIANHEVILHCAGRTDKGVHATGQVAHFDTQVSRSNYQWVRGINSYLSADIRVRWAQPVAEGFHARFAALNRRYNYVIYNHPVQLGILHSGVNWQYQPLDEHAMQAAADYLVGEHDFTSYRAIECQAKSPIRTLYHLKVLRKKDFIIIDAKANGFLHHMVRNIVGVLILIGKKQRSPLWATEVLNAHDRRAGGMTAVAQGLYFVAVEYPKEFAIPSGPYSPALAELLL